MSAAPLAIVAIDIVLFWALQQTGLSLEGTVALIAIFTVVTVFCLMALRKLHRRRVPTRRRRVDQGGVVLLKNDDSTSLMPARFAEQRAEGSAPTKRAAPALTLAPPAPPIDEAPTLETAIPFSAQAKPEPVAKSAPIPEIRPAEIRPWQAVPGQRTRLRKNGPRGQFPGERRSTNPVFSIPDMLEQIAEHGRFIRSTIDGYRGRIEELEQLLPASHGSRSGDVSQRLVTARRILSALEVRLEKLRTLSRNHSSPELFKACSLIQKPLTVPKDALHALLSSEELQPLHPDEWDDELHRLLEEANTMLRESQRKLQNW